MNIFVDIDGVLADFVGAALQLHKAKNPWETNPKNLGKYDIAKLLAMTPKEFWAPTDSHDFWANLRPYQEGRALLDFLELNFPGDKIYLATSPTMSPYCSSGKHEWVARNLPRYTRRLFIGAAKEAFAQVPGALLIDDADVNVKKFVGEGGRAILWPQPWNSAHEHMWESNEYFVSCFVSARSNAHLH